MGSDGHIKITDFGLSKAGMSKNARTVTICGTPDDCRAGLAKFDGVVDQTLMVNVGYGGASEAELLRAFRALIALGSK